jgi:hypothetical protein
VAWKLLILIDGFLLFYAAELMNAIII